MEHERPGILKLLILIAVWAACSLSFPSSASAETWKIITLDWPPYTDEKLPDKGAASKALAETLKSVGVDVEFVFMPWSRGVYEVKKEEYVGIFPSWTARGFKGAKLSPPLFESPIGFAYSTKSPHPWKTLQDFKGLTMGIVQDYQYPEDFLKAGRDGVFSLHTVNTDEQNLFKVAYRRIDVTIIDLINGRYLIEKRNPELKSLITMDPKVYKSAELFIAMKDDRRYNERVAKLKRGQKKVNSNKIIEAALKEIYK